MLGQAMTPAIERRLAALLYADEGMYRISELKHEPKDFSYKALRQEAARRKVFQPLYEFARTFLASAALSNESVKYYASLVQFYTVYKLQCMATGIVRLYLLCFAYHRFRQINDNLIEAFIHLLETVASASTMRKPTTFIHWRTTLVTADVEVLASKLRAEHVDFVSSDVTVVPENSSALPKAF